ncbi:MAG: DUF3482 domain-containing protein [Pseudomonadales bacterium]|nr:DUF3482 domain-containing protein [Pseudomonadales bacterium]
MALNPVFAVVGHPNKGKSSIVSTLAQVDSVAISSQSGTTRSNEEFTISLGEAGFRLIDTPGFQRPAAVLKWLKAHANSAEKRADAVRQFVSDPACIEAFPDETELLRPIVNGAAILYVVDGSRPYGAEYENEMEILRWAGQPSMALINPIESERYVTPWTQALGQYFRIVKVFNPMQDDFDQQMTILETFAHLNEAWAEPLQTIVSALRDQRRRRQQDSLQLLTKLLIELCNYQLDQKVLNAQQAETLKPALEARYFQKMKAMEQQAHTELKKLYRYQHLQSDIFELSFEDNLFDTEQWIVWGLNRKQLTMAATAAGAAAGAILDIGLAGHSLFLGALGGGLMAGGSAWFGADRIADYKVLGMPLGGYEVRQGPVRNRNFPYVVLGRFLWLTHALQHRNHARRDALRISEGELSEQISALAGAEQKALHRAFDRLVRQKNISNLEEVLAPLFINPPSD